MLVRQIISPLLLILAKLQLVLVRPIVPPPLPNLAPLQLALVRQIFPPLLPILAPLQLVLVRLIIPPLLLILTPLQLVLVRLIVPPLLLLSSLHSSLYSSDRSSHHLFPSSLRFSLYFATGECQGQIRNRKLEDELRNMEKLNQNAMLMTERELSNLKVCYDGETYNCSPISSQ